MKIKEVCEKTGLTERTVRFYVEKGLLSPSCIVQNGREYRDYSSADLAILNRVATLRRSGFTIEEIRSLRQETASVFSVASVWKERISGLAEQNRLLLQACENMDFRSMDFDSLADSLEAASRQRSLPPSDSGVNFGRLDGESRQAREALVQEAAKKASAAVSSGETWIKLYIAFSLIRDLGGLVFYLISGTFEFMDLAGVGLDVMLFIFLYLGYRWSWIVLLAFSGLGLLLSVPAVFSSFSLGVWWLGPLFTAVFFYNAALFLLLLLHKGIRAYLSYMKSVR